VLYALQHPICHNLQGPIIQPGDDYCRPNK
jgi:hypothetical protein